MNQTLVKRPQNIFFDNLDNVFNYLSSQTYPANFTRDERKQLRRKAKNFLIRNSVLFYILNGKIFVVFVVLINSI